MVPVAFGTAYLFLALFALPHVLAAPGAAALGPRSSIKDEALSLHNNWRVNHGRDNLTWSGHLETLAMLHGVFCKYDPAAPLENQAYTNSVTDAFNSWISDNRALPYSRVQANRLKDVGCAAVNCEEDGRYIVCMYSE